MSEIKKQADFYIQCNKLFITELKRIRTRVEKNRLKELKELIVLNEELENTSELDILDGYGAGCYDEEEYDRRIKEYREYQENKEALKNMPTIQTQLIKIIDACIRDTEEEISSIKMNAMTPEEKAAWYKKQAEIEAKRKARRYRDE